MRKDCVKYQGAVDRREKYTEKDRKAALFLYLEGVGFRPTAGILSKLFNKNFCYRTIMQWVQKAGRELENQKEALKEEIKILEMDEKTNKIRVWTAVNRNKLKFADSVLGGESKEVCKELLNKLKECTIRYNLYRWALCLR